MRLLKTRLRTRAELDAAMLRRDFSAEERVEALNQLEELKLVDDGQFARAWVHTRDHLAPRGEIVLRQELLRKGVPKDIIDPVLIERRQTGERQRSEVELARDLLERRERAFARLAPDVRKRRQVALLQRRGFSYSVIKRILEA